MAILRQLLAQFRAQRLRSYWEIGILFGKLDRRHEHLPPEAKRELKQVGWSKGLELAKLARRNHGQDFDCATWLHKAKLLPKEEFQREVENADPFVSYRTLPIEATEPRKMHTLRLELQKRRSQSKLAPAPRWLWR